MVSRQLTSFEAMVNYQSSRSDAGAYAQFDPSLVRLNLTSVRSEVIDIRSMSPTPKLTEHGFALVEHPTIGDWGDREWLWGDYAASCRELVKQQTGAFATLSYYVPLERRTERVAGGAEAARFIHMDQPRDDYRAQAVEIAAAAGHELKRGAIFNVWKAISPFPRDEMLAVADRRDVPPGDLVLGASVDASGSAAPPFYGLAIPDKPMPLYAAPDMRIDESLVFLSADFDPSRPLGCAHTSVAVPRTNVSPVPRCSIEARIIALFD